jgi:hypothetical protein
MTAVPGAAASNSNTAARSLSTSQAAVVAAGAGCYYSCTESFGSLTQSSAIGLVQKVNTFRFNDLSINYDLPHTMAAWFRVPRMTVALQGSNLALHTNYRGKDPGVNAFATVSSGDETVDTGQLPQPRIWWLKVSLSN